MEFFIKTKPEFKERYQIGTQINLSMGDKLMWVTITRIEEAEVFFEAIGDDGKYLKNLFKDKISTFSIERRKS